ncbi:caspase-9-like [Centroberyx affinis]|uniref:caspase-9-like n=1 Tax=Centroberyx affinis TaxID=166261 RepID=UPI003A5C0A4D
MATDKEKLLETLDDLGHDEFMCFKWFLHQDDILGSFPAIRKSRLEKADRLDTVDQMVQTYSGNTLEVTKKVLMKILRNDLVQSLSNSSSETKAPEKECTRPGAPGTRGDNIQSYKMEASPCGHCLIINNMEFEPRNLKKRTGSDIDCDKLKKRFKALNFIVEVKPNLKYKRMKEELSALSKKDHSQYDCCVVIIMSHGTEARQNSFPGAVHGVDGGLVPVELIINCLNGKHCPSLQGKPKLFFIQACGGGKKDRGVEVSPNEAQPSIGGGDDQTDAIPMSSSSDSLSMPDETAARATLPTPSDILVSYSTFPGYVSWRHPQTGSWYVEALDRILEENAATADLVTMLMMLTGEVSKKTAVTDEGRFKQLPGYFCFLDKLLYFQPQPQRQSSS